MPGLDLLTLCAIEFLRNFNLMGQSDWRRCIGRATLVGRIVG